MSATQLDRANISLYKNYFLNRMSAYFLVLQQLELASYQMFTDGTKVMKFNYTLVAGGK